MKSFAVHAVGAFSGVGADAPSTMGSLLVQLRPRAEIPFGQETANVAAVDYQAKPRGIRRLLAMAGSVLGEVALAELPWPLPIVLWCPDPDEIPCAPEELLARLCSAEPDLIAPKASRVFHGGRHQLPNAFAAVEKILVSLGSTACVLLGVDSLFDPSRLRIVEQRRGLRSMERPDGVLPGEAAVALVLAASDRVKGRPHIVSLATGQVRPGTSPGAALVATVEKALGDAGVQAVEVKALAHDMTSPAAIEELSSMMNRIPLASIGADNLYAPSETAGETGAASSLLTLAMMAFLREKQIYDGAGLCIGSDEAGFRSIAVVK